MEKAPAQEKSLIEKPVESQNDKPKERVIEKEKPTETANFNQQLKMLDSKF